ncbi:amino acid ABC transporter permease [Clostridium sp. YIM B02515]|uniref:Amino acid ABC transporter permease n=1 Tax=Clostridium rhizosphaerae TaxID=2803861 RepID=A0ABS1TD61_9CLOT|nr:amino acid ABC transporter permease [Clostridium rhizosphaerae]
MRWITLDTNTIIKFFPILIKGSITTIELTTITIVLGTALALLIAFTKISRNVFLNSFGSLYTWLFRGTPLLVQLFLIYYGLPQFGLRLDPFPAAVIGLTLNIAAYIAEVIRASIESIEKAQWEAAYTMGLGFWKTVFLIILPQSMKRMIPPLTNEFIALLKDTSLVSTIAMVDLMRTAQQISSTTFKPMEILLGAAILYLMMTSVFTIIFKVMETKFSYD